MTCGHPPATFPHEEVWLLVMAQIHFKKPPDLSLPPRGRLVRERPGSLTLKAVGHTVHACDPVWRTMENTCTDPLGERGRDRSLSAHGASMQQRVQALRIVGGLEALAKCKGLQLASKGFLLLSPMF